MDELWKAKPHNLQDRLERLRQGLLDWNTTTFRNIFGRKHRCKARLLGIQRALSRCYSSSLVTLEDKLSVELNGILEQEDAYWRQKARCKWHLEGDRNTRYFHALVVDRRRKGRILQLRADDGIWCTDPDALKSMARLFYRDLYTREPSPRPQQTSWHFPRLNHSQLSWLNRGVSAAEIKYISLAAIRPLVWTASPYSSINASGRLLTRW